MFLLFKICYEYVYYSIVPNTTGRKQTFMRQGIKSKRRCFHILSHLCDWQIGGFNISLLWVESTKDMCRFGTPWSKYMCVNIHYEQSGLLCTRGRFPPVSGLPSCFTPEGFRINIWLEHLSRAHPAVLWRSCCPHPHALMSVGQNVCLPSHRQSHHAVVSDLFRMVQTIYWNSL